MLFMLRHGADGRSREDYRNCHFGRAKVLNDSTTEGPFLLFVVSDERRCCVFVYTTSGVPHANGERFMWRRTAKNG